MKVSRILGVAAALALLAMLAGNCSRRKDNDFIINRSPDLPPDSVLHVFEGMGTFDVYLGMTRTEVEAFLGKETKVYIGLYVYKKDDVTYTIKYDTNNEVEKLEIDCNRFLSVRSVGLGFLFLACYDMTKTEMEDKYGAAPDRDENLTWWYDDYGVGFIYDFDNKRITDIVVYEAVDSLMPDNPLYILEGSGSWNFTAGTELVTVGRYKDSVEAYLGVPISGSGSFYTYEKDSVVYKILYDQFDQAKEIEFISSRVVTYIGEIPIGADKARVEDMYGTGHTDSSNTWRYEEMFNTGFRFDSSDRVASMLVFRPDFTFASVTLKNQVDLDTNGYLAAVDINYDIDISVGSDSVAVYYFARSAGDTLWSNFGWSWPFLVDGQSPADAQVLDLVCNGCDTSTHDILMQVVNYNGILVAEHEELGIKFEDAATDSVPD